MELGSDALLEFRHPSMCRKKNLVSDMGKTHEALIRAEEEYQKNVIVTPATQQKALVPYDQQKDLVHPAPQWYEELKSKLGMQYPDESLKTILFTGTSRKAGASIAAHGYADCLANDFQGKVLLIQFDLDGSQPRHAAADQDAHAFSNTLSSYAQFNPGSGLNRNGNLFAISCSREALRPTGKTLSNRLDEFLCAMRESFDYVILDTPPITVFSETRIMCNKVDGIILVLEFGKTRKQVASKIKQELEAAGGNILGVVINKRKYYIPKWLYKRL